MSAAPVCEALFTVRRELGLHARPAGRFVALAARFESEIQVARDGAGEGDWVSGRSVLSLLSLGAGQGTRLRVRAVGTDAEQAVASLGRLIEEPGESATELGPGRALTGGRGSS